MCYHSFPGSVPPKPAYAVLTRVSAGYPPPSGRSPTCYSPVRHSVGPEGPTPSDLHVLGTPPAFVLSQDQTRHPSDTPNSTTGIGQLVLICSGRNSCLNAFWNDGILRCLGTCATCRCRQMTRRDASRCLLLLTLKLFRCLAAVFPPSSAACARRKVEIIIPAYACQA